MLNLDKRVGSDTPENAAKISSNPVQTYLNYRCCSVHFLCMYTKYASLKSSKWVSYVEFRVFWRLNVTCGRT